jgi:hypothetical protein
MTEFTLGQAILEPQNTEKGFALAEKVEL